MTPGKYLVRIRWFNKMNGRQFDEWQIRTWDELIQRVRGGRVEGAVRRPSAMWPPGYPHDRQRPFAT